MLYVWRSYNPLHRFLFLWKDSACDEEIEGKKGCWRKVTERGDDSAPADVMEISMRRADDSRHVDGRIPRKRRESARGSWRRQGWRMLSTWWARDHIGAKRGYWRMQDRWLKIPKKRRERSHGKFWSIRQLVHIGLMMESFYGTCIQSGRKEGSVGY